MDRRASTSTGTKPQSCTALDGRPILDDDPPLAGLEDPFSAGFVEHPVGDPQPDAGHRRQLLLAERELGAGAALLVHPAESPQLAVRASGAVELGQLADLGGQPLHQAHQGLDEHLVDARVALAQGIDVGPQDLDDLDVRQRLGAGRADPFGRQDGHLAEHLARTEDRQQHRVAALATAPDPDAPADQHVHRVARLSLVVQIGLRGDLQAAAPSLERGAFASGSEAKRAMSRPFHKIHEHAQLRVPTRTTAWTSDSIRGFVHSMRTNATSEEVAVLVQRHFDGDAKALGELIEIFQSLVKAAARRVLRCSSDVDDAVQDTWLNFVRFGDRIADPERVGAWLWTVALNSARRIQRRDSRCIVADNVVDLADAMADEAPEPDQAMQRCERVTAVRRQLPRCARRTSRC